MGLYNYFPSPAEGVIQVLVMNTVLSVALLKNMVRYVVKRMVTSGGPPNSESHESHPEPILCNEGGNRARRVSITSFKSLCKRNTSSSSSNSNCGENGSRIRWSSLECCVCLCGFEEDDEEVSELSNCKHFFHKGCLENWYDNYQHTTCPLCRSVF